MTENPEPEEDDAPAQDAGEAAQEAEEPEVVAHADHAGEPPWCIGYMS